MADSAGRRNPLGPLRFSRLVRVNDCVFWDKTRPPLIEPRDDDASYLVKQQDRPDDLALTALGSTRLGWAIMERQDQNEEQMRLWPNDFYPGRKIFIPSRDSLEERRVV